MIESTFLSPLLLRFVYIWKDPGGLEINPRKVHQSLTRCLSDFEDLSRVLASWETDGPATRPQHRGNRGQAFGGECKGAGVPGLILGVDCAEPPSANTAVEGGGRAAGLIHGRNGLTRPLEVPGFCLIHLLQHSPSSCGQYTPDSRRGSSRVVDMSVGGAALKTIAKMLNAERIPAPRPRSGRSAAGWCPTGIRAMLHNQRYVGRIVWNRTKFVKVPGTNRRVARLRPESEWRTNSLPELRIVSDELWDGVQGRLRWLKESYKGNRSNGLLSRNVGSKYLFSGMLVCADCGGRLAIITGSRKKDHPRWGCPRNYSRGTRSNNLRERNDRVETQLLEGLQEAVLQPEALEYALAKFEVELEQSLLSVSGKLA